jgi:hypothetical protein
LSKMFKGCLFFYATTTAIDQRQNSPLSLR